jgi:hypothetical protein
LFIGDAVVIFSRIRRSGFGEYTENELEGMKFKMSECVSIDNIKGEREKETLHGRKLRQGQQHT